MTSKNPFSSKTFFCQSCKFKNQNFNEQSLAEKKKKREAEENVLTFEEQLAKIFVGSECRRRNLKLDDNWV